MLTISRYIPVDRVRAVGWVSRDTLNILRLGEWYFDSLVGSWGTNEDNGDRKGWLMSKLEWSTYEIRKETLKNKTKRFY